MRHITQFVHSKHKVGVGAFVGPRTFTNSKRRWQVRLIIDLPFALGAEKREVVRVNIDTPIMPYWSAAEFARRELARELIEYDDWTDFTWQVWAK